MLNEHAACYKTWVESFWAEYNHQIILIYFSSGVIYKFYYFKDLKEHSSNLSLRHYDSRLKYLSRLLVIK